MGLNGYHDNGYGTDSAPPGRADRRLDVGPGRATGGLLAACPSRRWVAMPLLCRSDVTTKGGLT